MSEVTIRPKVWTMESGEMVGYRQQPGKLPFSKPGSEARIVSPNRLIILRSLNHRGFFGTAMGSTGMMIW